jgi:hypothetical protein
MNDLEIIQVPSLIIQKWQEIIDLLAEVLHVPSALIMKVEPPNIRVFVRSESEGNPFERDELACLNTGMCGFENPSAPAGARRSGGSGMECQSRHQIGDDLVHGSSCGLA